MLVNPIYAGFAGFPKMVSDEQWVASAKRLIQEDGSEQFLVNLLFVLRKTFGWIDWEDDSPPDAK